MRNKNREEWNIKKGQNYCLKNKSSNQRKLLVINTQFSECR